MHKKVLTEVDLYTGEIAMPKGFEIDRNKIKNDILKSFVTSDRINNNSYYTMLLYRIGNKNYRLFFESNILFDLELVE